MTVDLLASAPPAGTAPLPAAQLAQLLRDAVPQLSLGLWTLEHAEALLTIPRGSQLFTSCTATWTDHTTRESTVRSLVVKQDRKRTPRWADHAARVLSAAGMGGTSAFRVARPYGVCEPGVLVSERVQGLSLLATATAGQQTGVAARCGELLAAWILAVQHAPAEFPTSTRRGLPDTAPQLIQIAAAAGTPDAGRSLARLARLLDRHAEAPEQPALPSHGDLHPANVFTVGDSVVAIDLDTVAAREPAYDVGYAVSHLVVSTYLAGAPLASGLAAAGELWDTYRRGGGAASDERIAVQSARALVQSLHFELVTYATGRTELLGLFTTLAETLLTRGRPGLDELPAPAAEQDLDRAVGH